MNRKARRRMKHLAPRRMVTTLGDLISAAYEAVPGIGDKKLERALRLLTESPLARQMTPHVEFVP
ncbi:hypothetical protein AnaeK_4218 [Anaeromyxobacter sp. K]|uniref:Uncharacterized protein n=1 Tax=Anaeromyxobacter dehalogenans (strain ATCC BAA-258 / DSM 21875 / 2CP-1) TaxID=455488 RepID=B8JAR1_ANAD2|nr:MULTISPECIES: hypothetical protein [Anaeromyxobacter]ACG75421.1 hypothetical protein AnaeK_4218 [Anaeromyxobacter sp. K]ACL67560.1 conserved hypothetical protein [Anaeromyxobacter dehalogenans 2CP-1]